jgi:hypothetical protein
MRFKIFAFIWFAALAAAPVILSADTGCCDQPMACCEQPAAGCCDGTPGDKSCCSQHATHGIDVDPIEPSAVEILIAMDPNAILPAAAEDPPVRQTAVVWFNRPVWVGNTVLMGKHVIEHDTDRQARGEPCTHIYLAENMTVPVATFHCTHLDRQTVEKTTVVLRSLPDGTQKLLEFQFAGEPAGHGFPTGR